MAAVMENSLNDNYSHRVRAELLHGLLTRHIQQWYNKVSFGQPGERSEMKAAD